MGTKKKERNVIPWPTKAAMQQVYANKLWGDLRIPFYSGEGSHDNAIVIPYIKGVRTFLKKFSKPLTVCDLGCGDFNIGKQLAPYTQQYSAVDIVPELIAYNKAKFKSANLTFLCNDIAEDDLPRADCAILRQVLQHLSNKEIKMVIQKLYIYKYVIVTEHIPSNSFTPNLDIISGQGTRLKKKSGVDVTATPFNLPFKDKSELSRALPKNKKGIIVTTLYEMF